MPRTEVDLAALEDAVAARATKRLRAELESLTRRSLAMYDGLDPSARGMARTLITNGLNKILNDSDLFAEIREEIEDGVRQAFVAGIEEAARDAGRNPNDFLSPVPREVHEVGEDAADRARQEIEESVRQVARVEETSDLEAALSQARRSVTRVENGSRWGVNRALAAGTTEVATSTGVSRLWVGERDACVHCLAYVGHVATSGDPFPAGLTFGAKPLAREPVPDPPLHPRCRCRIRLWSSEWDAPGTSTPDALKREALRSVLRGWSLPSESERTRLDAAERLLKRGGLDMPKSVQDYARRSLKAGHFPRGRDFPDADRKKEVNPDPRPKTKRAQFAEPPKRKDSLPPAKNALDVLPRKKQLNEAQIEKLRTLTPYRELRDRAAEDIERHLDMRATNPNYRKGVEWQVNCQRVAVTYELRRRGYDVTALPNDKAKGTKQYTVRDLFNLWHETALTGYELPPTISQDDLLIEVGTWPVGARGWIINHWSPLAGGGGHIWNVEVGQDGTLWFYDAQTRERLADVKAQYLQRSSALWLIRTDDKTPTEEQVSMTQPRPKKDGTVAGSA